MSTLPPELAASTSTQTKDHSEPQLSQSKGDAAFDADRDDLICNIRQLFRSSEVKTREEVISALQTSTGEQHFDDLMREELDNIIRTAVRRGILEHRGDGLTIATRSIADYERTFLKDQFVASMQGRGWMERNESIRAFARWLGFRRTGPAIDELARSAINGLIRDDRLESQGSSIRRKG